jgi:predicted nucleotidyltransferase
MFFDEPFGGVIPGPRGAVLAVLMRTGAPLTGRQVHALLDDRHSLWTVQQALKELARLGMIETRPVGRAGMHGVNEDHVAVAALRPLLSPIDMLTQVVRDATRDDVDAVLVFGSVARGDAHPGSDVDLAVFAPSTWERRVELEDVVRTRLGNHCDVIHVTDADLARPPDEREPVIVEILRDGVVLLGSLPRTSGKAAS